MSGCASNRKYEFIFPNGFKGIFKIKPSSHVPNRPLDSKGRISFLINSSTECLVSQHDFEGFGEWFQDEYRYESGERIPSFRLDDSNKQVHFGTLLRNITTNGGSPADRNNPDEDWIEGEVR